MLESMRESMAPESLPPRQAETQEHIHMPAREAGVLDQNEAEHKVKTESAARAVEPLTLQPSLKTDEPRATVNGLVDEHENSAESRS